MPLDAKWAFVRLPGERYLAPRGELVTTGCSCCTSEVPLTEEHLDQAIAEVGAFLDQLRELRADMSARPRAAGCWQNDAEHYLQVKMLDPRGPWCEEHNQPWRPEG